ncbi:tetratricopeptide repeat protein [Sphingosinicellaceae bacterium]|nr:tetratricopeptide repeat protein [Sphingosinicellaceae bacterium]
MLDRHNQLTLTTSDTDVVVAVDGLEAALLRYGREVGDYLSGPGPSSDSAYALASAAAIHLFALTAPGRVRAQPYVAAAEEFAAAGTLHEQMFVAGIATWARGDLGEAKARHLVIAQQWPQDLLSAKILQFHQLNTGDFSGMLAGVDLIVRAQPQNGFVHGMRAFALEQCGELEAAERAGRKAIAMGHDPWAHHAVAHVLDTQGRAREGRSWAQRFGHEWAGCSSFLYTHNWWHAALFELSLGDEDAALDLFDTRIWGVRRDSVQDQINAVSLLARLELEGVDAGDRWADIAQHLASRIDDRANPFVDLHLAYGLARAGCDDAVADLLCDLDARARDGGRIEVAAARAATGFVAHARRQYSTAAKQIGSALGDAIGFGGSHTQRRLLDLLAADAASKASDRSRSVGGWARPVGSRPEMLSCAS